MLVIMPFMMVYSMGLTWLFNMSPNHMIVNPSYGLFLIIQKLVLQPRYKINICAQPTFQNIGHQYNQFLKRYKWVLIQAKYSHVLNTQFTTNCNLYNSSLSRFDSWPFSIWFQWSSSSWSHLYNIISCKKEIKFSFIAPLIDVNFKVNKCVSNEMQQLKTTIQWHLFISFLQPFWKTHTIMQF